MTRIRDLAIQHDIPSIHHWLASQLKVAASDLQVESIVGGRSNVTSRVIVDGIVRGVLREPPPGDLKVTAHDLEREYRLLTVLVPSDIPVPAPVAIRRAPIGGVSYLMAYIEGTTLSDASQLRTWHNGGNLVRALSSSAETLGLLHSLPSDRFEVTGRSRLGGYIERQLRRWFTQWSGIHDPTEPSVPFLYKRLLEERPPNGPEGPIHGDYHFGNLILRPDGKLAAVVDWELATTGTAMADLCTYLAYLDRDLWQWRLSDQTHTNSDLDEVFHILQAYGLPVDSRSLGYYLAWAHWRLTCIGEGILDREDGDVGAGDEPKTATLIAAVERHALAARRLLETDLSSELTKCVEAVRPVRVQG